MERGGAGKRGKQKEKGKAQTRIFLKSLVSSGTIAAAR